MELEKLSFPLSVCKLASLEDFDPGASFYFFGRTGEELSLVCPSAEVPAAALAREDGWRGFRICGSLDFSLIGILARITGLLAEEKIGLIAVSTYDTDYILVKEENCERALSVLCGAGYRLRESTG